MRRDVQLPITRRETIAVALASDGLPTKAIAYQMGVTVSTATHHLRNARLKMQAANIQHLVALAMRQGLIQ